MTKSLFFYILTGVIWLSEMSVLPFSLIFLTQKQYITDMYVYDLLKLA